jgi:hypothetical protein
MSGALPGQPFTADDLAGFEGSGTTDKLLADAHVCRVTDAQARRDYGVKTDDATRDMSGICFPYFDLVDGHRTTARVRRDHPEIDADGKIHNKYMSAFGDARHLYFPPGAAAKLQQADMPKGRQRRSRGGLGPALTPRARSHHELANKTSISSLRLVQPATRSPSTDRSHSPGSQGRCAACLAFLRLVVHSMLGYG